MGQDHLPWTLESQLPTQTNPLPAARRHSFFCAFLGLYDLTWPGTHFSISVTCAGPFATQTTTLRCGFLKNWLNPSCLDNHTLSAMILRSLWPNADFCKVCQHCEKSLIMLTATDTYFLGKCCTLDTAYEETLVE